MKKRNVLLVAAALMLLTFTCTACGKSTDEMKSAWKDLMQQGEELNQELSSEAEEVNESIMNPEK